MTALPVVVRGALIGGGVGGALALVRRPSDADGEKNTTGRVVKSAAEGALAGAAVGFALDRTLRRKAAELVAANAPMLLDAAGDLVELARERAVEAYGTAKPIVVDAYEVARPRVDEAVDLVRQRALELRASA